jgi:hypothetical protein
MGVGTFVASTLGFDVDRHLQSSPFMAMGVFRKSQVPPKDNPDRHPRPDSGFTGRVPGDEPPDLSRPTLDAMNFLMPHESGLKRLKKLWGDHMLLDLLHLWSSLRIAVFSAGSVSTA